MAYALEWDKSGERLYENGVSNGVFYSIDEHGAYTPGTVWNGLTSISENPEGAEPSDLWADNIKYATLYSAETFGATIEAFTYPDEFAQCDGSEEIADGVLIGQQKRKSFGFCYRTEIGSDIATDNTAGFKLHLVYGAMASPSDKDYETVNDSPDAITFSWEITTTPVNVTGHKPTSTVVIDSTKANKAKLDNLMQILYGTPATGNSQAVPARMPLPDEIADLMGEDEGE